MRTCNGIRLFHGLKAFGFLLAFIAGLQNLNIIEECDEEIEDEDSEDEDINSRSAFYQNEKINVIDIPQAFSHFTYNITRRKKLVCDLQGVHNTADNVFELTDPVIHHKSDTGRKHVYGRTDHGKRGMHNFFKTHKCTNLCRMLKRKWSNK